MASLRFLCSFHHRGIREISRKTPIRSASLVSARQHTHTDQIHLLQARCVVAPSAPKSIGHVNHRKRETKRQSLVQRVSQLESDSQSFLKTHQPLDALRQELELRRLLLDWGRLMKSLSNHKELLIRATHSADTLARLYLDVSSAAGRDPEGPIERSTRSNNARTVIASSVTVAIHAWAKVQKLDPYHKEASKSAESLLVRLLALRGSSSSAFTSTFQPVIETYNGVIDTWAKSRHPDAAKKARHWLERAIQDEGVDPDLISYNNVLNAYANRGDADEAMALFQQMKESHNEKQKPEIKTYSIVMKAWIRSNRPQAATQVLEMHQDLIREYRKRKTPKLLPNSFTYGMTMRASSSPQQTQALLDEMIAWYQQDRRKVALQPSIHNFVVCMTNWAKVGEADKVEGLLLQMEEMYQSGCRQLRPNHQCFVVCLSAWAKQRAPESLRRAENVLHRMEELFLRSKLPAERMNAYGYNQIMNAYSRSGEENAVSNIQGMIAKMTRLGQQYQNVDILPDKISYASLTKALINERAPGFASQVEGLLRKMNEEYRSTSRASIKPDIVNYGAVLDAWAKSEDPCAAERVEALLKEMGDLSVSKGYANVRPTTVCFNILINIYSKQGDAERAEHVLYRMEELYREGNRDVQPDSFSFTSCVDAWARDSSKENLYRAKQLLNRMVQRYRGGEDTYKPTEYTFSALLMALAKSTEPHKARAAKDFLRVENELDIRCTTVTNNALLHALSCETGSDEERLEALELAMTTANRMRAGVREMDGFSFVSLLHACNNLISDEGERQSALEDVFHKCCEHGCVDDVSLRTLYRFSDRSFLDSLGVDENTSATDLPSEWRRNSSRTKAEAKYDNRYQY